MVHYIMELGAKQQVVLKICNSKEQKCPEQRRSHFLKRSQADRQIQYKKAGSTWIHELNLSHSMVMSMAKKEGKPWNLAKQVGKCLCFRKCTSNSM